MITIIKFYMQKAINEFSKRENWYILKSSARKLNKTEIAGKTKDIIK